MNRFLLFFFILVSLFNISAQKQLSLKTVVIDAGHGGKDPGAKGANIMEKEVTLDVALKLGRLITENYPDVRVVYTRTKDVFVNLDERAIIANKNKADLFISIHANSINKPTIYGTETFVLGLHRSQDNLEVAKKENSVIVLEDDYTTRYEGFDPNSPESYIIFELMQNTYLDQSITFAKSIEEQFSKSAGRTSRGVKQAGFLVLRETAMPSVLLELGFLSHKNEGLYLASAQNRSVMASAIFKAFKLYKQNYDISSNQSTNSNSILTTETNQVEVNQTNTSQNTQAENRSNNKISQSSILFRVQIATNVQPLSASKPPLSSFSNYWMYKEKNVYKYTVGESSNYSEIKKVLTQTKKIVPDAFIAAFENNVRIPLDDALKKTGQTR